MKFKFKILICACCISMLSACTAITEVTSSTSSTLDAATPDITLNHFIDERYDQIRKDAAVGGGENIDALAQLMGRKDTKALSSWMKANYDTLFSDLKQPQDLIARLETYNQPAKI